MSSSNVKPHTIKVPDSKISRLKQKLELTDLPTHKIEGADWKYGTPISEISRLHRTWLDTFSWRKEEEYLNSLPNFMAPINIDGFGSLNIHFLHQKSEVEGAIPLLFCHGWPGNYLEVVKMLPFLKGGQGRPAFDVVAISLPGYAWSEAPKKQGFELKQYAETCHKLMKTLGYDQYVTQGGDWGFMVTRAMGHLYPESVKGSHFNWIFAGPPTASGDSSEPPPEFTDREKVALARGQDWWAGDGRGYLAIQSTKPSTIAFSFSDSPTGLLSWIYEKLHSWSDDYAWTDNEILLWVSLYYFSTAGPEASSYHYYEALHGSVITTSIVQGFIDIPLGLADFPVDIYTAPKAWYGTLGPVVWSKTYEKGGHFAAWERPQDVADGLCEMFGKGGGAEGVVSGRSGY